MFYNPINALFQISHLTLQQITKKKPVKLIYNKRILLINRLAFIVIINSSLKLSTVNELNIGSKLIYLKRI